jgi:hypothetical protein
MTESTDPKAADPDQPGQARDERASEAARDSVDVDRRLPGEDDSEHLLPGEKANSSYREDAVVWVQVYSELLDFKRFMLDGAVARASQMSTKIAREEVETTDLRVARAEAERFARRLAFWRGRLDELGP